MEGQAVTPSALVALRAALKQSVLCLLAVPWQYSTYTAPSAVLLGKHKAVCLTDAWRG